MTEIQDKSAMSSITNPNPSHVGFYSAVFTVLVTIATFTLAITAVPISGANCPSECVEYPYLGTVAQYPKDFLWMVPAMLVALGFVALMASLHVIVEHRERVFSQIALSFALISASILLIDYYLQFSVVPVSLMNSETEGLAMLIQYNPHGCFLS
jgi:hypothetical protein